MLIKFRLQRWESTLLLKVLEQTEEIKGLGRLYRGEDISISSSGSPEISSDDVIYLRGTSKGSDNNIAIREYKTNDLAQEKYIIILNTFEEMADNHTVIKNYVFSSFSTEGNGVYVLQ